MMGRYVVNVLVQPLDAFSETFKKALLVNTEFLTEGAFDFMLLFV